MQSTKFAALAFGAALAATAAHAETIPFMATMNGATEVPATGSAGTGMAMAKLDTATKTLTWTITYSGLTGAPLMAHFHGPAAPGTNAGVAVPITGDLSGPIKGTATLTDAQIADLEAGKWYVNIHTPMNKGGEIRGQLMRTH